MVRIYLLLLGSQFAAAAGLMLMILYPLTSLAYGWEDFEPKLGLLSTMSVAVVHHCQACWRQDLVTFLAVDAVILATLMFRTSHGLRNAAYYTWAFHVAMVLFFVLLFVGVMIPVHELIDSVKTSR